MRVHAWGWSRPVYTKRSRKTKRRYSWAVNLSLQQPCVVSNIVDIRDVSPEDEEGLRRPSVPIYIATCTWQNEAATMAAFHWTRLDTPQLYCPSVSFRVSQGMYPFEYPKVCCERNGV